MIFDTHAHYDDTAFDDDRIQLLDKLNSSYMIINPGCDIASSLNARNLSEKYSNVYFAAGIHPEEISNLPENYLNQIYEISNHEKCIAIGEIGLDYYWDISQKELQKDVFRSQIELSISKGLPIIIHDREAHGDTLSILKNYSNLRGVLHCYSGSVELAREFLNMGFYLGFDGPVTYKNAKKTVDVLKYCPLERILIETDSPYMSPVPMRGKRNDSSNLTYVIEKINEIKEIDNIEDITYHNAKTLFSI